MNMYSRKVTLIPIQYLYANFTLFHRKVSRTRSIMYEYKKLLTVENFDSWMEGNRAVETKFVENSHLGKRSLRSRPTLSSSPRSSLPRAGGRWAPSRSAEGFLSRWCQCTGRERWPSGRRSWRASPSCAFGKGLPFFPGPVRSWMGRRVKSCRKHEYWYFAFDLSKLTYRVQKRDWDMSYAQFDSHSKKNPARTGKHKLGLNFRSNKKR